MYEVGRHVCRMFQLDTNRINSRSKLPCMNQLEIWYDNGVIDLELSEVALKEAVAGNNAARKEKAFAYIYSYTLANTSNEQKQLKILSDIIFPNGTKNSNQRNDVDVVFSALKYSGFLITNDGASKSQPGGILGAKKKLKDIGVFVMSDCEAVDYIKGLIKTRDDRVKRISEANGEPLPDWYGKD
ncbi:MAG: hypothetical protein JEZ00_16455 [Anaerolineaceae bacterium]|nr:hypothetical protein [Anaerolineaceae bacterium]